MLVKSQFHHHAPCPRCRERGADRRGNNLGIYTDGSKYCFSCGLIIDPTNLSVETLAQRLGLPAPITKKGTSKNGVVLPSDYSRNLPDEAIDWLRLYGINDAEIEQHHIGWSKNHERVIFPVFDSFDNLLMWQGRYIPTSVGRPSQPKCFTQGFAESVYHIVGDPDDTSLCIVEDILSCIKVSRVMPCMPLWGSVISTKRLVNLTDVVESLVIWLDHDKQDYAIKRALYARPLFNDNVRVVATKYDPKVYGTEEIEKLVKPNTSPL